MDYQIYFPMEVRKKMRKLCMPVGECVGIVHTAQGAHKDIALEFGMWISAEFKIYLIKEFQRLKDEEQKQLGRDIRRSLAGSKVIRAASCCAINTNPMGA